MGVNSGSPPDQATPYATNSYETSPYEASPYEASRQSDATYAPTNSGGHPAYGGGWYGP
jgi:hypothetical protein